MITREEIQKQLAEHTKYCFHDQGLKIRRHEYKVNEPAPDGSKGFSGTVSVDFYEIEADEKCILLIFVGNDSQGFPKVRIAPSFGEIVDSTPNEEFTDLSNETLGINRAISLLKSQISK